MVDEELDMYMKHLIRHASRATFPHWGRLLFMPYVSNNSFVFIKFDTAYQERKSTDFFMLAPLKEQYFWLG